MVARMEEGLAQGLSPEEARRRAARQMGGELHSRERARDADLLAWLDTFMRDLRYGLRGMAHSGGVTAVAPLSLGLGIGANTAIFSAVQAIVLRP